MQVSLFAHKTGPYLHLAEWEVSLRSNRSSLEVVTQFIGLNMLYQESLLQSH
jgi:hypothetical protein